MARKAKIDKLTGTKVVDKEFVEELNKTEEKKLNFWEKTKVKWEKVKGWFNYSESIFLARAFAFFGTVVTTVASFDWSPLWSLVGTGTNFTREQLIGIGISVVGSGILLEIARRRNATDL
jgi:hypothetical protein